MTGEVTDPAGPDIDVVLVTGLSGAGRGTAAKVLEDLGWYVTDNLPPELIARMVADCRSHLAQAQRWVAA